MKHIVVLKQFTVPRTEGGGTRHIFLFSRVKDWQTLQACAADEGQLTGAGERGHDLGLRHWREPLCKVLHEAAR